MRIAFFIRSMTNGGAEKVAIRLTHIWAKMGHEIVLLSELPSAYDAKYISGCIACECVGNNPATLPDRLESLYTQYKFSVAAFNDAINGDWFNAVFAKAKRLGLRTIIINHHTANNWMYGCGNTQELFMDDVLAKADAMVCVDRMWALWWAHRGIKTVFIANPVCIGARLPGNSGAIALVSTVDEAVERLRGKNNIIWIGRIGDALKRPELAVEVFSKLSMSTGAAKMTMLGNVSENIKRQLTSKIPVQVRKRIEFPGFVGNVEEYLGKADAHLFTSVTEVAIPQAILEAQMSGVDTVAFDQPVLRESHCENDGGRIEEKWRRVLVGEVVECDFNNPEVFQALMDELHRSQQWFALHHLPELSEYRRLKARMNPLYLFRRFIVKMRGGR